MRLQWGKKTINDEYRSKKKCSVLILAFFYVLPCNLKFFNILKMSWRSLKNDLASLPDFFHRVVNFSGIAREGKAIFYKSNFTLLECLTVHNVLLSEGRPLGVKCKVLYQYWRMRVCKSHLSSCPDAQETNKSSFEMVARVIMLWEVSPRGYAS